MLKVLSLSLIISIVHGSLFNPRIATYQSEATTISHRLPNNTSPNLYELFLETWVDVGRLDYIGNVTIHLNIDEDDTNFITLHSSDLNILEWRLGKVQSEDVVIEIPIEMPEFSSVTDFITFRLSEDGKLEKNGDYRLFIAFASNLTEIQNGFYRASYVNDDGLEKWFANTIFSIAEARTAFPCYDEPAKKAPYDIRIVHSPNYHAVSNSPVSDVRPVPESDHVVTTFQRTPPIMTYVLSFLISDYEMIENNDTSVVHHIYAAPAKLKDMGFALEASVKILGIIEEYLNVPYGQPKYDQIGLPNFAPEATENYAMVEYNENYLVYNPSFSRTTQKFTVARLTSHELAHQWFGNMVSPTWWTFTWLLEGFAVMAEYEITELAYPDLRASEMFPHRIIQYIFNPDGLESSRPLTKYGETKDETSMLYDGIVFFKTGSIFRMTQHFLTLPVWKDGLNRFLTTHQYSTADGYDFFYALDAAVQEATNLQLPATVREILDTWTLNKGYPIVEVIRTYGSSRSLRFTQQRFVSTTKTNDDGLTWWIPISIATSNSLNFEQTTPDYWLPKGVSDTTYQLPSNLAITDDDWLLINKQQTGYYRVNYDNENWLKLAAVMNSINVNQIHLLSRSQLLDDALDLGRANRLRYNIVLAIVHYLSREREYVAWASADEGLTKLHQMFRGNDRLGLVKEYFKEISEFAYNQYGATSKSNEYHHAKLARNLAIKWACLAGNEECLSDTADIMNDVIADDYEIEADLQSTIYCNGMRNADNRKFMALMDKLRNDDVDRNQIIDALSCNENGNSLKTFLTMMFNGTVSTSTAERRRAFNAINLASAQGLRIALEFFNDNSALIQSTYDAGIGTLLNNLANQIYSINDSALFNEILSKIETIVETANIAIVRDIVRANVDFIDEHIDEVDSYLSGDVTDGGTSSVTLSMSLGAISLALYVIKL